MNSKQLKSILDNHKEWLNGNGGKRADLSGADLSGADLSGANLYRTNLYRANLSGANLSGANLSGANLYRANLSGANLSGANLSGANLSGANLSGADLSGANLYRTNLYRTNLYRVNLYRVNLSGADLYRTNLYRANLSGADLSGADLSEALNIPFIPLNCPSEGSFIGFKKIKSKENEIYIIKLLIPEEAKRSSATTNKCRCEFAKVLEIQNEKNGIYEKSEKTEIVNYNNLRLPYTKYKIGEYVYPDSFDDNRFNECSHGIHFFINKEEAINYKV